MAADTMSLSQARAQWLEESYTERGATTRSWICGKCGEDIDSADLARHLMQRH